MWRAAIQTTCGVVQRMAIISVASDCIVSNPWLCKLTFPFHYLIEILVDDERIREVVAIISLSKFATGICFASKIQQCSNKRS